MRAPFTQIILHLVWSTWDRQPSLTAAIQPGVYASLLQSCLDLKCSPLAVGGMADHVHLLVRLHPAVAVSVLVQQVKGASSHLVNHVLQPGGSFRWQGAYGAFSLHPNEIDDVTGYIHNQAQHHSASSLIDVLETCEIKP